MNKLEKILTVGLIGLSACGYDNSKSNSQSTVSLTNADKKENNYVFSDFGLSYVNDAEIYAKSVSAGDFDGDKDLDLVIVKANGALLFYENKMPQKSGFDNSSKQKSKDYTFSDFGIMGILDNTTYDKTIVAADFDSDGDSDVAIVGDNGRILLYENIVPQKDYKKIKFKK